jgi:hypothetical protein
MSLQRFLHFHDTSIIRNNIILEIWKASFIFILTLQRTKKNLSSQVKFKLASSGFYLDHLSPLSYHGSKSHPIYYGSHRTVVSTVV